MCLQLLKTLFSISPPTKLPHPAGGMIYHTPNELRFAWRFQYNVYDIFWDDLDLELSDEWGVGGCIAQEKKIKISPDFATTGTLAHEIAHCSYYLLTDDEKQEFHDIYTPLKTEGLIKFLYQTNSYGLVSDIEGHAELFRYLSPQIPEQLHKFYPYLI